MKTSYLYVTIPLAVGAIIMSSCNKQATNIDENNYTPTEKANIERVKEAYALFSAHDSSMFDYFAENMVEKQDPEDIVGKKAIVELNKAFWAGFTNIRADLDTNRISASGDYTFAPGHFRGTNDGEFPMMGLSKTGKKIDVDFVEMIKWQDGKAVLSAPILNQKKMMLQLGLAH